MTHEEFEKYLIDNEKIDNEHFIIFEKLDELIDAIKTDSENPVRLNTLLYELVDFVKFHFKSEIEEMKKHRYPYIETHIQAHEIMTLVVQEIIENFENPGPMLVAAQKLHDSLLDHMINYDILYANYAKVMNAKPGW